METPPLPFLQQNLHLQLFGRLIGDGIPPGPLGPLGPRQFLRPQIFLAEDQQLGAVNLASIELPAELLEGQWMLYAYELWDQLEGGECLRHLPLAAPQPFHSPVLGLVPPCAIQPALERQPLFEVCDQSRNPCPGWHQRIHLYQAPGKPFDATAVLYLNDQGQVAAAELFNVSMRRWRPSVETYRQGRCWIRYRY